MANLSEEWPLEILFSILLRLNVFLRAGVFIIIYGKRMIPKASEINLIFIIKHTCDSAGH